MALRDELQSLRDRVLTELASAHDYYTDSKIAWSLVHRFIGAGHKTTIRNMTTGTIRTETDLAAKSRGYVKEQLTEATFQQFIAIFENWYFDLLRAWLTAYPGSLGKKMVDFKSVLELPDKDALIQLVVGKEVNEVVYDRPVEWFAYLEERAKLGCPTAVEIERIAEAKASRDVLVHNRGVANKVYESKAGAIARFHDGERIDIPEHYHRETWELVSKIVADVSNAAIAKTT